MEQNSRGELTWKRRPQLQPRSRSFVRRQPARQPQPICAAWQQAAKDLLPIWTVRFCTFKSRSLSHEFTRDFIKCLTHFGVVVVIVKMLPPQRKAQPACRRLCEHKTTQRKHSSRPKTDRLFLEINDEIPYHQYPDLENEP